MYSLSPLPGERWGVGAVRKHGTLLPGEGISGPRLSAERAADALAARIALKACHDLA